MAVAAQYNGGTAGSKTVLPKQRFTAEKPCPVCGGHQHLPQGQGVRCYGYASECGTYVYCTRAEYCNGLQLQEGCNAFRHLAHGDCGCGERHGEPDPLAALLKAAKSGTVTTPPGLGEPVAVYPYRDADGQLVGEVRRYGQKKFRPFTPDADGTMTMGGKIDVPYRLPELIQGVAAGKTVYVTEGEKDAEAIVEAGGIATTNAGGAGKWRESFAEYFAGAEVLIVQDRDDAGRKHAAKVLESIAVAAKSACIVEAASGKDASDHLAAGHGLDEFRVPTPRYMTQTVSLDAFLKQDADASAVNYVVKGWIARNSATLMASKPWAGKTELLLPLAVAVSEGRAWLGRKTEKGRVLLYCGDDPRRRIRERFAALQPQCPESIRLLFAGQESEFWEVAREWRPDLVIVETLQHLTGLKDLSEYSAVATATAQIQCLADETGAAVVASCHAKKKGDGTWDDVLGSVALRGSVDSLFMLRRTGDVFTIQGEFRCGEDALPESVVKLDEDGWPTLGQTSQQAAKEDAESQRRSKVIELLAFKTQPVKFAEIAKAVPGNNKLVREAVDDLVAAGKVVRSGEGKAGQPFTYALADVGF